MLVRPTLEVNPHKNASNSSSSDLRAGCRDSFRPDLLVHDENVKTRKRRRSRNRRDDSVVTPADAIDYEEDEKTRKRCRRVLASSDGDDNIARSRESMKARWHIPSVRKLVELLPAQHNDRPTLEHVMKHHMDGWVEADYRYGKSNTAGRMYASMSYQSVTKMTRNICGHEYMRDIDMQNAFPTLAAAICKRHGVHTPILHEYVANRETIIARITTEHPELHHDEVKRAFLVAMFCGNYTKHSGVDLKVNVIDRFKAELARACQRLRALPDFEPAWRATQKEKPGNPAGSFLSTICNHAEERVWRAARHYLEKEKGVHVRVNMFDGLMIDKVSEEVMPELLRGCNQAALDIGYPITFTEKEMVPKPFDEVLPPLCAVDGFAADAKVVCFDLNGTLIHGRGTYRPGVERLRKLQIAGFKVCLWTNQAHHNVRLSELEAKAGVTFDAVLCKAQCFRPSEEYRQRNPLLGRYDLLKPVSRFFKATQRVVLVDDTPEKVPLEDIGSLRTISTWTGDADDQCLHELIDELLGSHRNIIEIDENGMIEFAPGKRCIQPIEFLNKCTVIRAGMNSGKSHAVRKFIETKSNSRVLFLTARIQQAMTTAGLLKGLGFDLYSDVKGSLADSPRLICQLESLHRLSGSATYDYVVIDEVRSVASQLVCETTNGTNLYINNVVFEAILKGCGNCLLMDAHVEADGMVLDIARHHFGDDWKMYRYTRAGMNRHFHPLEQGAMIEHLLETVMKKKQKALACFRARGEKTTTGQASVVRLLRGKGVKVLEIFGETPAKDMKMFQDIDNHLSTYDVVAITSKVTVGSDIQTLFGGVYVFAAANGGATFRDIHQMVGRARNVADHVVRICFPRPPRADNAIERPPDVESVCAELLESRETRKRYAAYLHRQQCVYISGELRWSSDIITRTLAWKLREGRTDFEYGFRTLVHHVGMTIGPSLQVQKGELEHPKQLELKEAAALNREERLYAILQVKERLIEDDTGTLVQSATERVTRGNPLPGDQRLLDVWYALRPFPAENRQMLEIHDIDTLMDKRNRDVLYAARRIRDSAEDGGISDYGLDARVLMSAQIKEKAKLPRLHAYYIHNALTAAGFAGLKDYETEVTADTLCANVDEIVSRCSDASMTQGLRTSQSKTNDKLKRAVNALQPALRQVGLELSMKRARVGRGRKASLYRLRLCQELGGTSEIHKGLLLSASAEDRRALHIRLTGSSATGDSAVDHNALQTIVQSYLPTLLALLPPAPLHPIARDTEYVFNMECKKPLCLCNETTKPHHFHVSSSGVGCAPAIEEMSSELNQAVASLTAQPATSQGTSVAPTSLSGVVATASLPSSVRALQVPPQ